jgi:hypothetical protein
LLLARLLLPTLGPELALTSPVAAAPFLSPPARPQVYQRHSSNASADFAVDKADVCADINRASFEWALARAPAATRARFLMSGLQPRFLPDYHFPVPMGPLWIESALRMKVKWDRASKEPYLGVTSVSMRTSLDSWLNLLHPDSGGQHYCKALSPARAMEWIYTPERLRMRPPA